MVAAGITTQYGLVFILIAIGVLLGLLYRVGRRKKANFQGTRKKDSLVIGLFAEYKPFEFVNEQGEIVGFDVDFAREIASRLNKKMCLKNISFESLIPTLRQGEIDIVISGISITPDRLNYIEMIPYHGRTVRSFALIFWGEIPSCIKTIYDFKEYPHRRVAVQVGTVQEEFISKFDFIEQKPACNLKSLILDIRYGDSIAAIVKSEMAYFLQNEYPKIHALEVMLDEKDWVLGDGIGVRKGNALLSNQIKDIVMQLKANGSLSEMHTKWLKDTCCSEEYLR